MFIIEKYNEKYRIVNITENIVLDNLDECIRVNTKDIVFVVKNKYIGYTLVDENGDQLTRWYKDMYYVPFYPYIIVTNENNEKNIIDYHGNLKFQDRWFKDIVIVDNYAITQGIGERPPILCFIDFNNKCNIFVIDKFISE